MIGGRLLPRAFRVSGKVIPLARLILVGELAVLAGRHVARLDPAERTRLLLLLRQGRGRPSTLDTRERIELYALLAKMDPQVFVGTAFRRLSPVPVPRRVVEGSATLVGRALRGKS